MESDEKTTLEPSAEKSKLADEVKNFYKGELKEIFLTFFLNPIDGILKIFQKPSEKAYKNSLILFASVFALYFIGSIILAGDARKYIDFSVFIKIGLIPITMMFIISIIAFFIKSLSGNPDFKNELQTGGLCGIPISILLFLALIIRLFSDDNIMRLVNNPASAGTVALLFILYILLMLINVFQQSLKASNTEDAIAWYLAPASILFAGYLTFQISKMLF
jgi:hypothetical protein